jgi:tetraacyldisaccharide 4'-kinase
LKRKGIYFLYRVLQAFGLPWLLLYFVLRGFANRGYWRSVPQRFGFLSHSFRQTGPGAIWLHAVSVGEVVSCLVFLRGLRKEFPRTRIFLSTSTLAGRELAEKQVRATGLADGVFYSPVDTCWAVRRVLRALRPSLVLIAETEIWPVWFNEVKRTGAALAIVNGRISDRAYPRYRRWRWFFRVALRSADSILTQTDEMRRRFLELGAIFERVQAAGNFKYDFEARTAAASAAVPALVERTHPSAIWIAASTMPPAEPGDPDEDDAVLAAFRELAPRHPRLLLVLVPRKPERFEAAALKLEAAGIPYLRRSRLNGSESPGLPAVLLVDTIGELSGLFGLADAVFMGGSLAQRGGHNLLEPALFSKPVITGPHMENFQAIADDFRAAGALLEIRSSAELAGAVEQLLAAPERAREIGERGRSCLEAKRGATARAVARARQLYDTHVPRYRPAQPWYAIKRALASVWTWGGKRRLARGIRERRQLESPVISVGNLTMGGTGKTPCVLYLAEALRARGRKPGILTRGYARHSPERELVVGPGTAVPARRTGDEAQIFLRSGVAPVGIGGNRFVTGTALQRDFGVDVLVLDDGFQHVRLARDADILLLDALNPFGGGNVFPLGRLREPMMELERAQVVLISRSEFSDLARAIEREVRLWNPTAPVFRARLEAESWIDGVSGRPYPVSEPPFIRGAAFCGLGNPQAFRRTLEGLGTQLADWVEFPDHHRYRPGELKHLTAQFGVKGADAALTTEKDVVNLCDEADSLLAPLRLYFLRVRMVIEREEEFLREIERRVGKRAGQTA